MKNKIGIKINFYLFGSLTAGEVYEVNKEDNTVGIIAKGYKYPNVQTFKKLPKNHLIVRAVLYFNGDTTKE